MSKTIEVHSLCPNCQTKLDRVTNVTGEDGPVEGDFTICACCACVLVFGKNLELLYPPVELEIPKHIDIVRQKVIELKDKRLAKDIKTCPPLE